MKMEPGMGLVLLIPFLNIYIESDVLFGSPVLFAVVLMCQILTAAGGNRGLPALAVTAQIVSAVMYICRCFRLAKVFGKSSLFGLGVLLIPLIFLPALAFGKAEYTGCNQSLKPSDN